MYNIYTDTPDPVYDNDLDVLPVEYTREYSQWVKQWVKSRVRSAENKVEITQGITSSDTLMDQDIAMPVERTMGRKER